MRCKVIGAGFAGLVTAHYLRRFGVEVDIYDKAFKPGGLVGTHATPFGPVETAANGILATAAVEDLAQDLNLRLISSRRSARRRYFYQEGKLTQWPLGMAATTRALAGVARMRFQGQVSHPRPRETLRAWTERLLGPEFFEKVMSVAVQGIYAGDAEQLSARLIISKFLDPLQKPKRGQMHGTVSPVGGMGQWISALEKSLGERGVGWHLQQSGSVGAEPTVIATDVASAAMLLQDPAPALAQGLMQIEMLPLVSVTLFFKAATPSRRPEGFGVLFSPRDPEQTLGVLLNECIFDHRVAGEAAWSETWILGGAHHRTVCERSDADLLTQIGRRRQDAFGLRQTPLHTEITRWPRALPHCTVALEAALQVLQTPDTGQALNNVFLVGNFLGDLSLSRMVARCGRVARAIHDGRA